MKKILYDVKKLCFICLTIIILTSLTSAYASDDTQSSNMTTAVDTQEITEENENTDSEVYSQTICLTQSNYNEYKDYDFPENSNVIINESLSGIDFYIENKNVKISGQNNAVLHNSHIEVYNEGSLHLSNITFETDDESENSQIIILETDNNIIENVLFTHMIFQPKEYEYYKAVNIEGNNNTVIDCEFDIFYPSKTINWDSTSECSAEIMVVKGNCNNISRNSMFIQENEYKEYPYGTIFGLLINGDNNTLDSNMIYMEGTLYLYAVRIQRSNNLISNNYIEVHSIRYANGIAIGSGRGKTENNTFINNTIIVTTENATVPGEPENITKWAPVDAAYAIMTIESTYHGGYYEKEYSNILNNTIENNMITGYSSHMYALELFGATNLTISDNTIDVTGHSTIGVAGTGSGIKIINNIINTVGQSNQTFISADYFSPQTTGVLLQYGEDTLIDGNVISTVNGPALKSHHEGNTLITNNSMTVTANSVLIDIQKEKGITEIIGNAIRNLSNLIINGGTVQDNYDPSDKTDNNTQEGDMGDNSEKSDDVNGTGDDLSGNGTDVPQDTNVTDNNPDDNNGEVSNSTDTTEPENNVTDPEDIVNHNATDTVDVNDTDTNVTDSPVLDENVTVNPESNETDNADLNDSEIVEVPQTNVNNTAYESNSTNTTESEDNISDTEESFNNTTTDTVDVNDTDTNVTDDSQVLDENKTVNPVSDETDDEDLNDSEIVDVPEVDIPAEVNDTVLDSNVSVPEESVNHNTTDTVDVNDTDIMDDSPVLDENMTVNPVSDETVDGGLNDSEIVEVPEADVNNTLDVRNSTSTTESDNNPSIPEESLNHNITDTMEVNDTETNVNQSIENDIEKPSEDFNRSQEMDNTVNDTNVTDDSLVLPENMTVNPVYDETDNKELNNSQIVVPEVDVNNTPDVSNSTNNNESDNKLSDTEESVNNTDNSIPLPDNVTVNPVSDKTDNEELNDSQIVDVNITDSENNLSIPEESVNHNITDVEEVNDTETNVNQSLENDIDSHREDLNKSHEMYNDADENNVTVDSPLLPGNVTVNPVSNETADNPVDNNTQMENKNQFNNKTSEGAGEEEAGPESIDDNSHNSAGSHESNDNNDNSRIENNPLDESEANEDFGNTQVNDEVVENELDNSETSDTSIESDSDIIQLDVEETDSENDPDDNQLSESNIAMMEVFKGENQQSKLSSVNSNAGLVAAKSKTRFYELTKKLPENVEFVNQYMVLLMLLIMAMAFIWGFVKQNKNLK